MIEADDWQPADDLILEPNAMVAATEKSRNLALTAGPGAGKTEMLAQRADFLLQTGLCRYPRRILAISFKVDASHNLKERVRQRCGYSLATRFDSYTFHAFAKKIIDRFRPVLTGSDALDSDYTIGGQRVTHRQITFNELVPFAIQILRNSKIARNAVRKTYSDVFLDEFQDCTDLQYQLIQESFLDVDVRLVAVGDTKQRIMGWAGALEGIFIQYAEDFNARPLNLYQNFRSLAKIRRLQNEIIKIMDVQAAVPDTEIVGKEGEVEVLHFNDCQEEADQLTSMIEGWIDVGVQPSQIAVLVSKQPALYTEKMVQVLTGRGVAFRDEQSLQDISTEPAARLLIDFLTVVHSEGKPDAYIRLMNLLVFSGLDEDEQSASRVDWQIFLNRERKKANSEESEDVDGVWKSVIRFLKKLSRERVVSLSADYEQGNRLNEIIKETKEKIFSLFEEIKNLEEVLNLFSDDSAIRIMTIHKSKGLEFEKVIMLGVEKETFWGDADAERCAFFVGISRAKESLVLTHVDQRTRPASCNSRWTVVRNGHDEFLSYVGAIK